MIFLPEPRSMVQKMFYRWFFCEDFI